MKAVAISVLVGGCGQVSPVARIAYAFGLICSMPFPATLERNRGTCTEVAHPTGSPSAQKPSEHTLQLEDGGGGGGGGGECTRDPNSELLQLSLSSA